VAGRIGLALVAVVALALFIGNREVPESEAGRPEIAVEFPEVSEPGSIQTATFTITNPSDEPMASTFMAFTRVGPAAGGEPLPLPIVDPGAKHENPAIVSIDPEPDASSIDAVVFRFPGLDPGEAMTVVFELRVPEQPGPAANSVSAYPGEHPDRAKGVRLGTEVGG
jgi:hypothetical protein